MTVTVDQTMIEIFNSGKSLYEFPQVAALEFEAFLTKEFRSVQSFQGIDASSSLRDLKNSMGGNYSNIKFYLCCKSYSVYFLLTLNKWSRATRATRT